MPRKPKAPPAPPPDPYENGPIVIETFHDAAAYDIGRLTQPEPSCWNGIVRVTRYRITVERIDEPAEVIHERLRKLWDESDNFHHTQPLRAAAARVGLDLDTHERGRHRPRRKP